VLRLISTSMLLLVAMLGAAGPSPESAPLALSHAWIVVKTGAKERAALERAGFRIAPTVNRHDGQGTASITVELLNGFIELIYPDSTVAVSPGSRAGAEKFRLKSDWRQTGVAPGADRLPPAASYVAERGIMRFDVRDRWLLEVTLDEGRRGVTQDLQPELPLVIHY